jgi:agmatine deiminase
MPPEWARHERTLMAWPRRRELWGPRLGDAKLAYAATANAIVAFEPVTVVCADAGDAEEARRELSAACEIVELPIDDSWLRDTGPIFVLGGHGARAAVHFRFNGWGGKFAPWDRDAKIGRLLAEGLGDRVYEAPFVLEGGSIAVDGTGTLMTTEQCLLNPNRNPELDRDALEWGLRDHLGVDRVIWLGRGLVEDRDTDGHVDLIAAFTRDGEVLLQSAPKGHPDHEPMAENRARLEDAGIGVLEFPILPMVEVEGKTVVCSHLNFYVCNGALIAPVAGQATDEEALERIAHAYPGRETVGVPGAVIAWGGGGPHCITQQVPLASLQ